MDERQAIQILTDGARGSDGLLVGPGDDAALLEPPSGKTMAWTTDVQEEGRHFRRRWLEFGDLARRALAVNLSDLAAMGARPWSYLLAIGAPPDAAVRDFEELAAGFRSAEEEWGLSLAGGHTWCHPHGWMLMISLAGLIPDRGALRRDHAQPGMGLYVSGTVGGAARGLEILSSGRGGARGEDELRAVEEWLRPEPRISLGIALRQRHDDASVIDLSDGLSTDLHHLCRASGVGARIEVDRLPLDPALASIPAEHRMELALHGGEDYELLFATPRSASLKSLKFDKGITRIGEITAEKDGVTIVTEAGKVSELPALGHDHFLQLDDN